MSLTATQYIRIAKEAVRLASFVDSVRAGRHNYELVRALRPRHFGRELLTILEASTVAVPASRTHVNMRRPLHRLVRPLATVQRNSLPFNTSWPEVLWDQRLLIALPAAAERRERLLRGGATDWRGVTLRSLVTAGAMLPEGPSPTLILSGFVYGMSIGRNRLKYGEDEAVLQHVASSMLGALLTLALATLRYNPEIVAKLMEAYDKSQTDAKA